MPSKILVISGSAKNDGNTAALIQWFTQGARVNQAEVELVHAFRLNLKAFGCTSCRECQGREGYECVINDDISPVLKKMIESDVIVMATPLYFFSATACLKAVIDRMFSLYKWNNQAGTFTTPLKGKTLVLLGSAYEDVGLEALAKPFELTADYTGMAFLSFLVPNAGVSGDIRKMPGVSDKAMELGKKVSFRGSGAV